jgi:hypothetical protein
MKFSSYLLVFPLIFAAVPAHATSTAWCWLDSNSDNCKQAQEEVKVAKALSELESIEQRTVFGGSEAQLGPVEKRKLELRDAVAPVEGLIYAQGMRADVEPSDWDFKRFDGNLPWLRSLQFAPADKRCEMLTLAYIFAVWKLDTLEPETPILSMKDIRIKVETDAVLRERRRAAWQLRYLHFIPTAVIPADCQHIAVEAEKRWNFIFTKRRALGFAIGMCGRPMSAHYLDDEVENKTRTAPEEWHHNWDER